MAKVTWTYIEESFYQQFARMSRPAQHGIITGLRAIMLSGTCGQEREEPPAAGDLFEEEAPAQ